MMNYNNLFNSDSAATPEFDPLLPHDHRIGDFDGFTCDIQEWPLVDSCLFDCPTAPMEPRVDVPYLLDFDADTALPPPKRARVEEGLKSLTMKDFRENFNSNYSKTPEPDLLKPVDFADDINRWIDSCLNFGPTEPCVDATGNIADTIKISSMQPSTSSSQLVDEVALSAKSPQPPLAMLDNDGRGKKTERKRWSPEEHRLFLMGVKLYGEGNWKIIAEEVVKTRTHIQIASHAQKHYLRCKSNGSDIGGSGKKKRKSIHDVTIDHVPDLDPYRMGSNNI